ncbi:MAG TPA: hypothetical protein O0X23_04415 [Methanocorpusculum sp.]|nr:hypothetical protein [Methanocorpusculum sp.]
MIRGVEELPVGSNETGYFDRVDLAIEVAPGEVVDCSRGGGKPGEISVFGIAAVGIGGHRYYVSFFEYI